LSPLRAAYLHFRFIGVFDDYVSPGRIYFPKIIWWRIGGEGLAAMIVAPIVFLVLHWLALSLGLLAPREEREAAQS